MQQTLMSKNDLRYVKALSHGGSPLRKRRKVARPLVPGAIHHLVLKSSKARGELGFYKNRKLVAKLLLERSRRHFVEILQWVNVGNHLHLKVRFKNREQFQNFLRTFTALLARKLTGARRNHSFGRFWDALAFTRILTSKYEELGLRGYFSANLKESEHGKEARDFYQKKFNRFLYRLRQRRARSVDLAALSDMLKS